MRIGSMLAVSLLALALVACGGDDGVSGAGNGEGGGGGGGDNGGATAGSSAAGSYDIDKDAMKASMTKLIASQTGGELTDQHKQMIDTQIGMMNMAVTLSPDGTFAVKGQMGGDSIDAMGTWKVEGDKISIVTTHEDGKEQEEPETKTAAYADGKITITEGGAPFPIVLIRK